MPRHRPLPPDSVTRMRVTLPGPPTAPKEKAPPPLSDPRVQRVCTPVGLPVPPPPRVLPGGEDDGGLAVLKELCDGVVADLRVSGCSGDASG